MKFILIDTETKEACLCFKTELARRVGVHYTTISTWYDKASSEFICFKEYRKWLIIFEWEDVKQEKGYRIQ